MEPWSSLISAVRAFGILEAIDFLERDRSLFCVIPNFYFRSVIKWVSSAEGLAFGGAF